MPTCKDNIGRKRNEKKGKGITKEELCQFLNDVEKGTAMFHEQFKDKGTCNNKCPSKHWNDIVSSSFRNGGKEKNAISQSFKKSSGQTGTNSNVAGECYKTTVTDPQTRRSKRSGEAIARGTQIHKLLANFLQKRESSFTLDKFTQAELQVGKLVESIEKKFGCQIIWGEKRISAHAFAINDKTTHQWRGQFDAIGLMNDGQVIVIEWRTCDDVQSFWNSATQYKEKVYQSLLYRELLTANMRDYFDNNEIPAPGIMIVPIDRETVEVNDPRLCLDFRMMEEAGILDSVNQLRWHVKPSNLPSQNGSSGQKINPRLDVPLLDIFVNRQKEVEELGELESSRRLSTMLSLFDLLEKDFCIDDLSKEVKQRIIDALNQMPDNAVCLLSSELPQLTSLKNNMDEDSLQVSIGDAQSAIKPTDQKHVLKRPSVDSLQDVRNQKVLKRLHINTETSLKGKKKSKHERLDMSAVGSQRQSDLGHATEALTRQDLVKNVKSESRGSNCKMGDDKVAGDTSLEYQKPTVLGEKVVSDLLEEWCRLCRQQEEGKESEKAFTTFIELLRRQGIHENDALMTKFLCISTELCVKVEHRALEDHGDNITMAHSKDTLDDYCHLLVLLVHNQGDGSLDHNEQKIKILRRILTAVAEVLLQDHKMHQTKFRLQPYFVILDTLLEKFSHPEPVFEAIIFQILMEFGSVFYSIRPSCVSGFRDHWFKLIFQPIFMFKLLNTPSKKGWDLIHKLFIELLRFLRPYWMTKGTDQDLTCQNTSLLLTELSSKYPEFLCNYHKSFCDVIPPKCIKLQNAVFSAFTQNKNIAEPFMQTMKNLHLYLKTGTPETFVTDLKMQLKVSSAPKKGYKMYNTMNTLVLCVGTQAITYTDSKGAAPEPGSPYMIVFESLAMELDPEGRDLLFNALINQLRHSISHTHFFSSVLLHLFNKDKTEAIRKGIISVLSKRLTIEKRHPDGLLYTFNRFRKTFKDMLWEYCSPEIKELSDSAALSTIGCSTTQLQEIHNMADWPFN
ncbi:uncharacterized protein LOC144640420 isoform X2 [Oculina patagonica]